MNVELHSAYIKAYRKRIEHDPKLVKKVKERIEFFLNNPSHPLIRDHALQGTPSSHRAFCINGDIRIIYEKISDDQVLFLDIGTHDQVY